MYVKRLTRSLESLKVAALGDEFKVIAAVPGWFKVENGDDTGYVFHSYLTEDKAAVDALVKAKQEADAAAAQAASSGSSSGSTTAGSRSGSTAGSENRSKQAGI